MNNPIFQLVSINQWITSGEFYYFFTFNFIKLSEFHELIFAYYILCHSYFLKANPIINSSVLLKKSLCSWDETTILEDYDLWLRMKLEGKQFFNIPNILVFHRIHKDSAFNNINRDGLEKLLNKYRK